MIAKAVRDTDAKFEEIRQAGGRMIEDAFQVIYPHAKDPSGMMREVCINTLPGSWERMGVLEIQRGENEDVLDDLGVQVSRDGKSYFVAASTPKGGLIGSLGTGPMGAWTGKGLKSDSFVTDGTHVPQ